MKNTGGEYKYFKVNEAMLETDLKLSEIWVYLTHCRSRGTRSIGRKVENGKIGKKKDTPYSIAKITRVRDFFGNKMNNRAYSKAMKSLEAKGLLYMASSEEVGVNIGFYGGKSTEVVGVAEPKDKVNIQIPREMLDDNVFREMSSNEILTVIKLYKNYNYNKEGLGAIDLDYIMAEDSNTEKGYHKLGSRFGSGFNRSIYHKDIVRVTDFNEIYYDTDDLDIDIVENLIERKLFNFKPVIIETDIEDENLYELKYEIFKGLVKGSNLSGYEDDYLLAEPMSDEGIVWVLEPSYRVLGIKPTEKYLGSRSRAYERAKLVYTKVDLLTDRENRRYGLYYGGTYEQAKGLVELKVYEEIELLENTLHSIVGDDKALYIYNLESNLESLHIQHYEEKELIKKENERLLLEENYRSRRKATPRLKTLERSIEELSRIIENEKPKVEELESKLLDLIPIEAMEEFYFDSSGGYEFENVGRATRLKRQEKD